jgi:hypothetical protein
MVRASDREDVVEDGHRRSWFGVRSSKLAGEARRPGEALGALFVSASAFALYVLTLAPTVTFVDSGELLVVAAEPGVPHPPGMPLYTMLAHAATWLPVGSIATRVHLLSALCGALACGIATLLVAELAAVAGTRSRTSTSARKGARAGPRDRAPAGARGDPAEWTHVVAAIAAGLLLACARTLWAYATLAEVYTLTALLLLGGLYGLVRWRRGLPDAGGAGRAAPLYAAAACFALALGVHYVMVGLLAPAIAVMTLPAMRARVHAARTWTCAAAIGASGLLLYLYLPLAASGSPLLNWGDPDSLERFWWHITGRQYQVFLSFSAATMAQQFGDALVPFLLREFGPRWLPLALTLATAGGVRLWTRDRRIGAALALVCLVDVAYALNYDIDEDQDAYYLPAFLSIAVLAGVGLAGLLARAARAATGLRMVAWSLALLLPLAALLANLPYNDRSRFTLARDYVANLLGTVPPGGLVITLDWQVYSPWLYLHHLDGVRPDVSIVDINLLRRPWYLTYLERAHPDVVAPAQAEMAAYLEDLIAWERDPDRYQRDPALNRRINERYYAMILAVIRPRVASPGVFATLDTLTLDRDLAGRLSAFAHVPQGLVFELRNDTGFVEPASPTFVMPGLFDETIAFEPDDVVQMKVRPVYVSMLVNRGRYLEAHGRPERALPLYREALALDPANVPAQQSIGGR